ncbi:MAG: glycoside hydrolase family 172 protein [Candidatus Firestonebacteria bacterium]
MMENILKSLMTVSDAKTKRESSWDKTGRNADWWKIKKGETRVLADIKGPGCLTHIWMTQSTAQNLYHFRKVLIKIYWDGEKYPSVLVPVGDFFCLGNSITNSFCSLPFTASANNNNRVDGLVALNCYLPMPFNKSARVEIENQGDCQYSQYFYIDYELYDKPLDNNIAYFHANWKRENPCGGWAHEILVNTPEADVVNLNGKENYVILEASGKGHYIGCNISVTNLQTGWGDFGTWWGEGDDMIFIDGEKWPPSLHGTGSEDYFNQAYGMQDNKFLFNGSSIFEKNTGGFQTSYVFHLSNPVRFQKSIKATLEHGHANHLSNEFSSTAYWYQIEPHKAFSILPVKQRLPLYKEGNKFINPKERQTLQKKFVLSKEMIRMKKQWKRKKK